MFSDSVNPDSREIRISPFQSWPCESRYSVSTLMSWSDECEEARRLFVTNFHAQVLRIGRQGSDPNIVAQVDTGHDVSFVRPIGGELINGRATVYKNMKCVAFDSPESDTMRSS